MAAISDVLLQIFEGVPEPGSASVQVSYKIEATLHDVQHEQAYRELVELVGVDVGPGEDGQSEVIFKVSEGTVVFTNTQVRITRIPEKTFPIAILDEDRGPIIRTDEILARVTLTPLPQASPSRDSNVVHAANLSCNRSELLARAVRASPQRVRKLTTRLGRPTPRLSPMAPPFGIAIGIAGAHPNPKGRAPALFRELRVGVDVADRGVPRRRPDDPGWTW